jgi:16S rRNA A1518/A1519 N6-dimethyltransferase RsmA/KsgA/DIM1 with predicted DNA glycosylase/AP lyase activity
MDIAAGSFWPVPGVVSRAVAMTKRDVWPNCANPATFAKVLRALFSSRRKTVRNNLSAWLRSSGRAAPGPTSIDSPRTSSLPPGSTPANGGAALVKDFRSLSDRVDERAGGA